MLSRHILAVHHFPFYLHSNSLISPLPMLSNFALLSKTSVCYKMYDSSAFHVYSRTAYLMGALQRRTSHNLRTSPRTDAWRSITVLFIDTYFSDLAPNVLLTKWAKSDHILSRGSFDVGKSWKDNQDDRSLQMKFAMHEDHMGACTWKPFNSSRYEEVCIDRSTQMASHNIMRPMV